MKKLKEGDIINAKVEEVADYGVKISCENMNGFIQIPELSWDISGLQDRFKSICGEGEVIQVKVLAIGEDRFSASLRQAQPEKNPWINTAVLDVGTRHVGVVNLVAEYGYLIKLENTIVALMPIEEAKGKYKVGDNLNLIVKSVDFEKKKLNVSEEE